MQGILTETVHVLVTALAIADTAGIWTESALGLLLDLTELGVTQWLTLVALLTALRREKSLELLEVLWWREVA